MFDHCHAKDPFAQDMAERWRAPLKITKHAEDLEIAGVPLAPPYALSAAHSCTPVAPSRATRAPPTLELSMYTTPVDEMEGKDPTAVG